jgi:hypothetical protein
MHLKVDDNEHHYNISKPLKAALDALDSDQERKKAIQDFNTLWIRSLMAC